MAKKSSGSSAAGATLLGQHVALPASPEEAQLERVPNPHTDTNYVARFTAPEFTSLCPVTGQPDFAHIVIDYIARDRIVESKSLKLFLINGGYHTLQFTIIGLILALWP